VSCGRVAQSATPWPFRRLLAPPPPLRLNGRAVGLIYGWKLVEADYALLGEFHVSYDGADVTPSSLKGQALLATLAVRRGQAVAADTLVEELWPALPPDRGRRVLQVRVAEIRKQLSTCGAAAASTLESTAAGYRLEVAPEALDSGRFVRLVRTAESRVKHDDLVGATTLLREALGLWHGSALAGIQLSDFLETAAAELEELRLAAVEERVAAELADGCRHRLVGELETLVAEHPLRERFWELLVLALYRSGRQTEALRAAASVRRLLAEEVGVSPGHALRALEAAVLAHDPGLDVATTPPAVVVRPDARETRVDPSLIDQENPRRRAGAPPVQYIRSPDGVNIAYQVTGEGPDLLLVPGFISHLDVWWEPWGGQVTERLSEFARLIVLDKRGMGLSDRPPNVGINQWLEDVELVRRAAGAERPIVFGISAGGTVATTYAARHAEHVRALILYGSRAKYLRSADYPYSFPPEKLDKMISNVEQSWGSGDRIDLICPSAATSPWLRSRFQRYERLAAGPAAAARYLRALYEMDVRDALPDVAVPTLVVHATGDRTDPVEQARYMAERLPQATMVELDSNDHLIWLSDARDQLIDAIRTFVTALPQQ
jgi:pimeloyl-ACP methyl ester carboxylesterase/DNA-binding SARP family transcriptional activator